MASTLCLLLTLTTHNKLLADGQVPDPAFLELLGIALEIESLGIDVDKLIEERLEEERIQQEASEQK